MSRAEPGRPLTAVPHPSPSNRPAGPPRPAEEGTGPMGDRAAEPRWLELRLPSRPENVGVARVAVAAFAAQLPFTLSELEEIKVAVSEAVTNAVVHGYGHGRGVVTIRAGHDGRRLWVEVADSGRGIADIEQARQPAFSTDPERMGMGFAFMEAFMDQVDVESAPGAGTTVRLYKRPRPKEQAPSPDEPAAGDPAAGAPNGGAPPSSQLEAAAGRGDGSGSADAGAAR